eukprot:3343754-Rhodomonas_salina.2
MIWEHTDLLVVHSQCGWWYRRMLGLGMRIVPHVYSGSAQIVLSAYTRHADCRGHMLREHE